MRHPKNHSPMKKPLSIIIVLLLACHCFGQEKEQQKSAFTYSAGLAYNQIWLQSNLYGADEYGVSSSPFNWGISPFFSMQKNRWKFGFSCSYQSLSRNYRYSETRFYVDKWQELCIASTVGFRLTGEHSIISVTPFLGFDLSYLINYEKTRTYGGSHTRHYNTDELCARRNHNYSVGHEIPIPFGISLLGGIGISCPITKHFDIGLSYCAKFKVINDIRNCSLPDYPSITSPKFYHNASIGVSYRFN